MKKVQNFVKKVLHFYFFVVYLQSQMRETNNRGVAQLVSASGLGPEGPVFESQYPDKNPKQLLEFQVVAFLLCRIFALCCKIGNFGM